MLFRSVEAIYSRILMITIEKINNVYIRVYTDQGIAQEISQFFTFEMPGARFTPQYRAKLWDGKIILLRLTSKNKGEIYHGLLDEIVKFANNRGYSYSIADDLKSKETISKDILNKYIDYLNIGYKGEKITLRDYQIASWHQLVLVRSRIIRGLRYIPIAHLRLVVKKPLVV